MGDETQKAVGTSSTDCSIYRLLGSRIIKDFEWQAKEFGLSVFFSETLKYSEWGDDIKKVNLATLLIRVGEVLLASAGLGGHCISKEGQNLRCHGGNGEEGMDM